MCFLPTCPGSVTCGGVPLPAVARRVALLLVRMPRGQMNVNVNVAAPVFTRFFAHMQRALGRGYRGASMRRFATISLVIYPRCATSLFPVSSSFPMHASSARPWMRNGRSPLSSAAWSSMTVVELKAELKERGLKVSGKKAELIERLSGSSSMAAPSITSDASPATAHRTAKADVSYSARQA